MIVRRRFASLFVCSRVLYLETIHSHMGDIECLFGLHEVWSYCGVASSSKFGIENCVCALDRICMVHTP